MAEDSHSSTPTATKKPDAGPPDNVVQLADHLFRRRYGRMVAALTRTLGSRHLELAEEAVQEALLQALRRWPYAGVPDDPEAWLLVVARNRARDRLRRQGRWQDRAEDVGRHWHGEAARPPRPDETTELDEELALVVMTCHPALGLEDRVALTLKTACGLSVDDIARALLKKPATVAQRLVRAKSRLHREGVRFRLPSAEDLAGRLPAVLDTLYLLFNEGHTATTGEDLLRPGLAREAIRLADLLTRHPGTDRPEVHALLALFWLQTARFSARTTPDGALAPLREQDRTLWDQCAVARGIDHLARSARGAHETHYHLEAALAAAHSTVPSYEETDWPHILTLYDRLLALKPSPVVALNRVVALAEVEGAGAALASLADLPDLKALERNHLRWAVEADLHRRLGNSEKANFANENALACDCSPTERHYLEGQRSMTVDDLPVSDATSKGR